MASLRSRKTPSKGKTRWKWRIDVVVRIDALMVLAVVVLPALAALPFR